MFSTSIVKTNTVLTEVGVMERRTLLQSVGATSVGLSVAGLGRAVAENGDGRPSENERPEVIYQGNAGRVVKVGAHAYVLRDARSEAQYEQLHDELEDHVFPQGIGGEEE